MVGVNRMSFESVAVLAHAMGRTLVLPPAQPLYLLKGKNANGKRDLGFADFFPIERVRELEVITMTEFLEREGERQLTNMPKDISRRSVKELWSYLWTQSFKPKWKPISNCILFAKS